MDQNFSIHIQSWGNWKATTMFVWKVQYRIGAIVEKRKPRRPILKFSWFAIIITFFCYSSSEFFKESLRNLSSHVYSFWIHAPESCSVWGGTGFQTCRRDNRTISAWFFHAPEFQYTNAHILASVYVLSTDGDISKLNDIVRKDRGD